MDCFRGFDMSKHRVSRRPARDISLRSLLMARAALILIFSLLACSCSDQVSPSGRSVEGKDNISANYKFTEVQALALSKDSTLRLTDIWTRNVHDDGFAASWSYRYGKSFVPPTSYYFPATYDSVRMDSISTTAMVGSAFITHMWMNSCAAAEIAEDNGGRDFRSANPGCTIGANLGEPVIPNPSTYWLFVYRSTMAPEKYLSVKVDATFGTMR